LRSNSNQPREDDGDHPGKPLETHTNDPTQVMEPKKVREVNAMVRNHLNKTDSEQVNSSENWPGFVALLEQNPKGEISCSHHLLEA